MQGQVLSLFHKCDSNNDNILDMDEFYRFAHLMYDAADFYHVAARNALSDGGSELASNYRPPDSIPKSFGVISQEEWDCTQNPAGTGLEQENCPLDNSQTRVGLVSHFCCEYKAFNLCSSSKLWLGTMETVS